MQTANTLPETLTYGIQLWELDCLYFDGRNYRYSRAHSAVDPAVRGRIAVPVNQALKCHFASPAELRLHIVSAKGHHLPMHSQADTLRQLLPRGSSIYTVATRESRTGESCQVLALAVVQGEIVSITQAAAALLNLPAEFGNARINMPLRRAGAGFASQLAIALYQDAHALKHQSLGGF
jgi:hypothetical protein